MPRGFGRGMGQGRGRRQRRIVKFLRPCLLLMLQRQEAHGYNLLASLQEFGFNPDRYDSSMVYRDLREMENIGFVTSQWNEDSRGPQRRVYKITERGIIRLQEWITDLHQAHQEINTLLEAYENLNIENQSNSKKGE